MIRAVVFDFNGILVDDEAIHCALFREILAEVGVAMTDEAYHERYLGFDDRGCFEAALRDAGRSVRPGEVDAMIARKATRYFEVAESGLRIFPNAAESLAEIADRWPVAINSGALRAEIEFALDKMGVRDRVVAIVSAEDATRGKPDPMGYLLALEALRHQPGFADLEPRHGLAIEDSLAGIASAKSAGMMAVGVAHTYSETELADAGADAIIADLTHLSPAWVDRMFGAIESQGG